MGIPKTLLYPFSINSTYFDGYSWAIELSLKLKAKLQLFTTTDGSETAAHSVYQSLLEAHGYYLHHFRHDNLRREPLLREPYVIPGEPIEELVNHLKNNPVDILIVDAPFQSRYPESLRVIVKESAGAILLSNPPSEKPSGAYITDHFYNHLRHAEFNRIPGNFFSLLGRDRSVFNYLRKFFQNKPGLSQN